MSLLSRGSRKNQVFMHPQAHAGRTQQPILRRTDPIAVDMLSGVRQASQRQEGDNERPDKPWQAPILGAGAPLVLRGGTRAAGQGGRARVGASRVKVDKAMRRAGTPVGAGRVQPPPADNKACLLTPLP